jgi:hypothetical protein
VQNGHEVSERIRSGVSIPFTVIPLLGRVYVTRGFYTWKMGRWKSNIRNEKELPEYL